jgi:hypothetical protein
MPEDVTTTDRYILLLTGQKFLGSLWLGHKPLAISPHEQVVVGVATEYLPRNLIDQYFLDWMLLASMVFLVLYPTTLLSCRLL